MNPNWRKDYIRYKGLFAGITTQYRARADLKAYLEMMLSLITISVFMFFALRPTILTIAQLMKDIEAKKATLAVMNEKIENLSRARSLYEAERSKIAVLESAIPKSSEPDTFSRQIEGLVGAYPVEVVSLTIGKGAILGGVPPQITPPSESESLPSPSTTDGVPEGASGADFSVTTAIPIDEYPTMANFLESFEKLRRPSAISEVRFIKGQERDGQKIVLFMRGKLPYLLMPMNSN